jgi:hypothetical protein
MTFQEEIAELQARIAAARDERDDGRAAALQQSYLDACCRLDRLEQELEGLRQQGLRAFASHDALSDARRRRAA